VTNVHSERNGGSESESVVEKEARTVARGRATRTPFVALGAVAATVWLAAGAIVVLLFVLIWLI
jgi:hypothetical protein